MSNYLEGTHKVTNVILRSRLIDSGIKRLDTFFKKSDDFVHKACQTIRKVDDKVSANKHISMELEETLHNLQRYCRYWFMIQRPFTYAGATLDNIEIVSNWLGQFTTPSDFPVELERFTDSLKKRQWLEGIEGRLQQTIGKAGLPIAYAVRHDSPLPAVDPGIGLPSLDEELQTRGRHTAHFWAADNRLVWNMIYKVCFGTTAWSLAQSYEKTKNVRMAYRALVRQYMGPDTRHLLMQEAGRVINDSRFDNKSRNFTFDKFCARFRQARIDHGPDNQLSPELEVVKIMDCWQVPELMHLIAMIFGTDKYKYNLEETITFLSANLRTLQTTHKPKGRNVSGYEQKDDGYQPRKQGNKKGGKGGKKGSPHKKWSKSKHSKGYDPKNPGKYVKGNEWKSWTDEEKAAAREDRRKKGIGSSAKEETEQRSSSISALKTQFKTVRIHDDAKSDSDTEMEDEEAQPASQADTSQAVKAFNSSR